MGALLGLGDLLDKISRNAGKIASFLILPLIFLAVGQSTGILLVSLKLAFGIGALIWLVAITLVWRGSARFSRDRIAATA